MTIASTTSRTGYPGAGSVGPYAVPFRIQAAADLLVVLRDSDDVETELVLDVDYAVTGVGDAQAALTLTTALAVGETLSIRRAPVLTQPTSIQNQGSYFPKTHEDVFDRLAMQLQSLQDQLDRSVGILESYDPAGRTLRLKPETGKALVWQSASELGNAQIDSTGVAIPGEGRTVSSVSAYLLNNAVFNVLDYGATGAESAALDTAGVLAAIAAANATIGPELGFKSQVGAIVYFPAGTYRLTEQLLPFPGVTLMGEGIRSTTLMFDLIDTKDAIVYSRLTPGVPLVAGFAYGGAVRDISVTTLDINSANHRCNAMVKVFGVVEFNMERVFLSQSFGRLLHIENCLSVVLSHVRAAQSKATAGVWIGATGSITTTVRAYHLYVSECYGGPNIDVGGLSIDFYGLVSESAGAINPGLAGLAGAYGIRVRSGRVGIYSPYFEDNADHDIYVGSDVVAGVTTVVIDNPTIQVDTNKIALKGGVYLDNVAHATIRGGDYSATSKPLQITANCGQVDASYYAPGKPPLLTSGAHWRTKTDLNFHTKAEGYPQRLSKNGIAPAGTAVLTIPCIPAEAAFARIYARVQFDAGANLQATVEIVVSHESDAFADGGALVRILHNNSAGNFNVVAGNFVATFTAAGIIITYTCTNGATNNSIQFFVEGVNIGGDISLV